MTRSSALVLTLTFGAIALAPRIAHAGCSIECASIQNGGITITPPLDCVTPDGAPDDNACVCASSQRYVNNCEGAVEVRPETIPSGCTSCGPKTYGRGESFEIEVRVPTNSRTSGERYSERATERYTLVRVDDPAKTEHVFEIAAEATIDPEASACSASPRPFRRSPGAFMAGALGIAVLAVGRRVQRRSRV